jgi:hypothetical protein
MDQVMNTTVAEYPLLIFTISQTKWIISLLPGLYHHCAQPWLRNCEQNYWQAGVNSIDSKTWWILEGCQVLCEWLRMWNFQCQKAIYCYPGRSRPGSKQWGYLSICLTLNIHIPLHSETCQLQHLQCIWPITNGPTNGGFKQFAMVQLMWAHGS